MDHQGILQAIPHHWKELIDKNIDPDSNFTQPLIHRVLNTEKRANLVYRLLVEDDRGLIKYNMRWSENENTSVSFADYKKAFSAILIISKTVKLRDFQYRLLLGKIPTNDKLFKWKIATTDKCQWCNKTENIFHTLLECKFVVRIWRELEGKCKNIIINRESIVLNKFHESVIYVYNLVGLILKQFLYRYRCQSKRPSISAFKTELKNHKSIENYIYSKELKRHIHLKKWSPVENFIFSG